RRVFGLGNRPGESDAQASRFFPQPWNDAEMIVASPLARGTMGYQTVAETDVYDVLHDVRKRFSIDEDRIYLTGLSMGGGGVLWLGFTRPDTWAALAAVCPAPPEGVEPLAGNALNLPVKLFQGALDPIVPASSTSQWHSRLRHAGVSAEYVEYPGVRHNSWDRAYRGGAIFEWLGQFRRNRNPERVRFRTDAYKYGTAYWLRIDRLTPGQAAEFDGTLKGPNLEAKTSGIESFSVVGRVTAAKVDGQNVARPRAVAGRTSFHRTKGGRWAVGAVMPGKGEKRRGAEGPIADAISTRHVYVYGAEGRVPAEQAADWSTRRSRLNLSLRVLRDTEIAAGDIANANVVAFGTRETNRLIARYADQLPMHLNPGAADYGLLYAYPVEGRYVVVSSGLPWWTRHDQAPPRGLPFLSVPYRILGTLGDFVLFKGGLDNVVAEGRFDNKWQLPQDTAARLRATGAVTLRP
ncbi:MAG TPA: dienelactone hydrolase family protein, partial [Bryobacteraceae bacterium]|nr:dienelactone hydrolase family protein [Bryobacteraceae bacterium]